MEINCCICLDTKKTINFAVSAKCKHWYHKDCIKEWMDIKNKCPLCNGILSGKDIISIPTEILQGICVGNTREMQEKDSLLKDLKEKLLDLQTKLRKKELECQKQVLNYSNLQKELHSSREVVDKILENYKEENRKRIKAEAFTKHWNFSSTTDFTKWEQEWDLLEKSIYDADSLFLKELLKEYHKYFINSK
jgi:hypothetical protein